MHPAVAEGYELVAAYAARFAAQGLSELREREAFELDAELVEHIARHRDTLAAWLDETLARPNADASLERDPAGFLSVRVMRFVHAKNPFIERIDLRELGHAALEELRAALDAPRLAEALARVAVNYQRGLARRLDELDRASATPGLVYRETVSAEYSPELQLAVFGLDATALAEPILDLGCGERALLVEHFTRLGKKALGVDRVATPRPGVVAGDWLELGLPASSFGTVLSHLAFSQHFLFHHLAASPLAESYARRYMQILHALAPHGLFAYVPGLPFIESLLPTERWRVERREVPELEHAALSPEIPLYSAKVTRVL